MELEDLHPTSGVGGPERGNLIGNDRDVSEHMVEGGSLLMETPSSSSIASKSSTNVITENILYMKLFHEFKQLYPKVPDDTVIQCVRQYGTDRKRCNDILSVEADRAVARRFSLQGKAQNSYSTSSSKSTILQDSASRNVLHHSNTTSNIFSTHKNNNRSVTLPFGLHFPERRSSISRFSTNVKQNVHDPHDDGDNKIDIKNKCRKIDYKKKDNNCFDDEKYKSTSTIISSITTAADSCINTSVITQSSASRNTSADSIPMVVLTPESPPYDVDFPGHFTYEDIEERRHLRPKKLLYSPYGYNKNEKGGVLVCGNVSSLMSAQFDVEMESLSSSSSSSSSIVSDSCSTEEDVGICSLSTTTLSQGAVHLVKEGSNIPLQSTAFTTIRQKTLSISSSSSDGSGSLRPDNVTRRSRTNLNTPVNRNESIVSHIEDITPLRSAPQPTEKTNSDICHEKEAITNENPFRRIFTKRKQFYQRFCDKESLPSSDLAEGSKLVWRRHCTLCCSDKPCPNKHDRTLTHHHDDIPPKDESKHQNGANRITLNANIEPFAPFTIHHDGVYGTDGEKRMIGSLASWPYDTEDTRSEDPDNYNGSFLDVRGGNGIRTFPSFSGRRGSQQLGAYQLGGQLSASRTLSNCGSGEVNKRGNNYPSQKTITDGDMVHYATSTINSEDGVESHLEVSLGRDGDTVIKTSHKLLVQSASQTNIIHPGHGNSDQSATLSNNSVLRLQYAPDGKTLNITSSQTMLPNLNVRQQTPKVPNCLNPEAYTSMLQGNHPRPSSAYYTQQCRVNPRIEDFPERYNSLPNLYGRQTQQLQDNASSMIYDGVASNPPWTFQSYPADEEKRVAYTRNLLSHQMHQQLKLSEHLKYEKKELQQMSCEVRDLEMKLDRRQLQLRAKLTPQHKSQIEHHLEELQNNCQNLADEVTELTNGAVPLGETSFEFYESLPLIISNTTNPLSHSSSREFNVEVDNNARETCTPLPKEVSNLENEESCFATMETLAKPLPPPNRSTFYVPITKSPSSRSGPMSSPTHQTNVPSSGPSSPLGEVADTVISGAMAGVHAVIGVPSAVSSLPIYDSEERVSVTPDERLRIEQRVSTNESGDLREPQWSCAECTFLNHPALKECEQCEMPRVMIGCQEIVTQNTNSSSVHGQPILPHIA